MTVDEVLNGADERIRTADLRITSALLYLLSHIGLMSLLRVQSISHLPRLFNAGKGLIDVGNQIV